MSFTSAFRKMNALSFLMCFQHLNLVVFHVLHCDVAWMLGLGCVNAFVTQWSYMDVGGGFWCSLFLVYFLH